MDEKAPTLAQAVGDRCKQLRLESGFTLEELADAMRRIGFPWTTSRVAELEKGRVAATVGTLAALASAINELSESELVAGIAGLLPVSGPVEIAPGVVVEAENLERSLLHGRPLVTDVAVQRVMRGMDEIVEDTALQWLRQPGWTAERARGIVLEESLIDVRAAKTLRVTLNELHTIALGLWGKSLSYERDSRAPEGANAQAIGRITRELLDEARTYLRERRELRQEPGAAITASTSRSKRGSRDA